MITSLLQASFHFSCFFISSAGLQLILTLGPIPGKLKDPPVGFCLIYSLEFIWTGQNSYFFIVLWVRSEEEMQLLKETWECFAGSVSHAVRKRRSHPDAKTILRAERGKTFRFSPSTLPPLPQMKQKKKRKNISNQSKEQNDGSEKMLLSFPWKSCMQ